MANPNSQFIIDELNSRTDKAKDRYSEPRDPESGDDHVWQVRERVAKVVDKIMGEEHEDRYDILGKTLDLRRKKGLMTRMFGSLGTRLSRMFSGAPSRVGSTEMPDMNHADYSRVVETMQDVMPASDIIEDSPEPTPEMRGMLTGLLGEDAVRSPEMAFVYREIQNDDEGPEIDPDYQFAIEALTPSDSDIPQAQITQSVQYMTELIANSRADDTQRLSGVEHTSVNTAWQLFKENLGKKWGEEIDELAYEYDDLQTAHPGADVVEENSRTTVEYDDDKIKVPKGFVDFQNARTLLVGIEDKSGTDLRQSLTAIRKVGRFVKQLLGPMPRRKPPTIFQLRVLAKARRFARERYQLLGDRPDGFDEVISPDDFRKAYVAAYMDRFGFENEDLRRATLVHAMRQLNDEENKKSIDFETILKKSGISKKARKALNLDMTNQEISTAISDGKVTLDEAVEIVSTLRTALRNGRIYGRDLTLKENFGPFMLRLHNMHRLYTGLDELEGLDEVALHSETDKFIKVIETKAQSSRDKLERALRGVVGQPPIDEDEDYAEGEGTEEEGSTADKADRPWAEKAAERFSKLNDNPLFREAFQAVSGSVLDWAFDRILRRRR